MRELWRDMVTAWYFLKNIPPLNLAVTGAIAVLALILLFFGRPLYYQWEISRFEPRMLAMYEKGQYGGAVVAGNHILSLNPRHYEANRTLAVLTTRQGSPAALSYWRNVVQLRPNLENHLDRARAAMQFGEFETALAALRSIEEPGRNTFAFHTAALDLSMALERLPQAEHHLIKLSELDPENRETLLLLARARLLHPDEGLRENGLARLHSLLDDKLFRSRALQGLVLYYLSRDPVEALPYARSMMREDSAGAADLWLLLDLFEGRDPLLAEMALEKLSDLAREDPGILAEFVDWHLQKGRESEALAWISSFSVDDTFGRFPVGLAQARIPASLQDWDKLREAIGGHTFRNP